LSHRAQFHATHKLNNNSAIKRSFPAVRHSILRNRQQRHPEVSWLIGLLSPLVPQSVSHV